jgi:hypothetical protein
MLEVRGNVRLLEVRASVVALALALGPASIVVAQPGEELDSRFTGRRSSAEERAEEEGEEWKRVLQWVERVRRSQGDFRGGNELSLCEVSSNFAVKFPGRRPDVQKYVASSCGFLIEEAVDCRSGTPEEWEQCFSRVVAVSRPPPIGRTAAMAIRALEKSGASTLVKAKTLAEAKRLFAKDIARVTTDEVVGGVREIREMRSPCDRLRALEPRVKQGVDPKVRQWWSGLSAADRARVRMRQSEPGDVPLEDPSLPLLIAWDAERESAFQEVVSAATLVLTPPPGVDPAERISEVEGLASCLGEYRGANQLVQTSKRLLPILKKRDRCERLTSIRELVGGPPQVDSPGLVVVRKALDQEQRAAYDHLLKGLEGASAEAPRRAAENARQALALASCLGNYQDSATFADSARERLGVAEKRVAELEREEEEERKCDANPVCAGRRMALSICETQKEMASTEREIQALRNRGKKHGVVDLRELKDLSDEVADMQERLQAEKETFTKVTGKRFSSSLCRKPK